MSQSYTDELRATFGGLIDGTDLGDRERQFLKLRWLDQVLWMESKAGQAQRFYYRLRLLTITGAVIVPALVALNTLNGSAGRAAQIATWVVSLIVAISAGETIDRRRSGSRSRAGSSFSSPGRTPPSTAATPTPSAPSRIASRS